MARKKAEVNADVVKAPKIRKKKDADKQQNLEDILYECRNKLRGNANMTTKRDMLLTLVFLRFIGSRYNEQREKIRKHLIQEFSMDPDNLAQEDKEYLDQMLEDRASYQKDGVFYLKDEYNWDSLIKISAADRSLALDNGISLLMKTEKDLKNALPSNLFVNAHLEPSVLKGVMDDINKIDPANFKDIDLIGRVYEYFLQQFAVNAEKEEGEFYTPQSIVELIANLIEPFDGTIYDPCCGSGGMFVQSVRLVEAHGGNKRNITVYGQESDPDTYRLAKMNLAARGISYHLGDTNASSFTADKHPTLRADYIMANPPFNKHDWRTEEELTKDIRWKGYGLPPVSNANYAWILHMLYHLDKTHGIAGFLLSNGALEDEDTVKIREQLIKNDKVEAIFILPREMFYTTDTSVTLWIMNQNKSGGQWHGHKLRNREGEILFVDLRRWNQNCNIIKADKTKKSFTVFDDKQMQDIITIYRGWQTYSGSSRYEKNDLYYAATVDEIDKQHWSLAPSRYIHFSTFLPQKTKIEIANDARAIVQKTKPLIESFKTSLKVLSDNLDSLTKEYTVGYKKIAELIEVVDNRNIENNDYQVCGMNKTKTFMPTIANLNGIDTSKYKIVRPGEFAFSGMQTGRDECIRIAMHNGENPIIISPAYTVFKLKDDAKISPEFFLLFFKRNEMDRYGWFISDSSVRASLDWPRFLAIDIPIPEDDIQHALVDIYDLSEEAKRLASVTEKCGTDICPAFMQYIVHS